MTSDLIEAFPSGGGRMTIEPDASSGSYFWAAGHILAADGGKPVAVTRWPETDWQIDANFPSMLPLTGNLSRQNDLGDSIMTAISIAPLAIRPVRFTELGRLRLQECERVMALRNGLAQCGATVIENGDTLDISPGELHGATIETYDDHRVAMCFATLGLKVPGIRIKNPTCVRKTFPTFFKKLVAPAPQGLGATLLDEQGRRLNLDQLTAD